MAIASARTPSLDGQLRARVPRYLYKLTEKARLSRELLAMETKWHATGTSRRTTSSV